MMSADPDPYPLFGASVKVGPLSFVLYRITLPMSPRGGAGEKKRVPRRGQCKREEPKAHPSCFFSGSSAPRDGESAPAELSEGLKAERIYPNRNSIKRANKGNPISVLKDQK